MENNKYLQHLQEVTAELAAMSEDQLLALLDGVELNLEEAKNFEVLEAFILSSDYLANPVDQNTGSFSAEGSYFLAA